MSSAHSSRGSAGARRLPTRAAILELLEREPAPVHIADLARKLRVESFAHDGLARLLDDMALSGAVAHRAGDRFTLGPQAVPSGKKGLPRRAHEAREPQATRESDREREPRGVHRGEPRPSREGFVSITPRGAGFVSSAGAPGDDVFVPHESIGGAMHGDKVEVMLLGRGTRGPEGTITRIIERGVRRVAGTLRRRGQSAWLEPDDTRMRGPIPLTASVDVRGPEGNSGSDGDAAVVSITRYPTLPDENPEGLLEAVLGRPGELSVEAAKVLVTEHIEELHSEDAVREAEAYGEQVPADMLAGREDLTHLPLPTIDPEDARDHDDAVWVERTADGGYRAFIAIADVSSYVRPGTKLDAEALARGCSVYLPDRAIPMLPRALSSNLCSLLPDVTRLCLCAEVSLDAGGNVKSERLIRGFMVSRAKLTYGGVARALGFSDKPPVQPAAEAMVDGLRVAAELSRMLRGKRMKRGALDFELPEAKIVLGEEGLPVAVERRSQDPGVKKAYQLIEELMLLGNEVVARWLASKQVPTIYRVHASPDVQKLQRFLSLCEELSIVVDPDVATDPKKLSELLKHLADHPKAAVLNMLLLRSMKQASYDIVNIGHFGLASKAYLHFTSPIRRYPDLVVHRAVHAMLQHQRVDRSSESESALAEAALLASKNERRAMEVEREIGDLYRAFLMRDRVGERFEGTVTSLVGTGAYVALDEPFVDVLVRFDALGGSGWELDETGLRAVGGGGRVIQLGDRIVVEVTEVSLLRRTVYARRAGGSTESDGARGKSRRPREVEVPARPKRDKKPGKNVRARVRAIEKKASGKRGKKRR